MTTPSMLTKILDWLRAGYPDGMPQQDYVALLGLLSRRLTKDEVREVAHRLILDGVFVADEEDIAAMITQVTNEPPLEDDIARVAAHLAAGGWPLAMLTEQDLDALRR